MKNAKTEEENIWPTDRGITSVTIDGSITVDDDDYEEFPDRKSRSIVLQLAEIGDMTEEEINRLSQLNEIDRSEEIDKLNKEVKQYLFLMIMIAVNTAWFFYILNVVIYYDKNELRLKGSENAKVQTILFLPWSFKPIWGVLSDSFFIFGYRYPTTLPPNHPFSDPLFFNFLPKKANFSRFKSHCIIMSFISSLIAAILIFNPRPSETVLVATLICYSLAVSYVDALAEGISAIVTKLNERIAILEDAGKGHAADESMKALGLFNSFRGVIMAVMTLLGGYVVQWTRKTHLLVTGIILAVYPIIFCFQTLFIFKEKKVTILLLFD